MFRRSSVSSLLLVSFPLERDIIKTLLLFLNAVRSRLVAVLHPSSVQRCTFLFWSPFFIRLPFFFSSLLVFRLPLIVRRSSSSVLRSSSVNRTSSTRRLQLVIRPYIVTVRLRHRQLRFARRPWSSDFITCRAASCATCCRLLVRRRRLNPLHHWVRFIFRFFF